MAEGDPSVVVQRRHYPIAMEFHPAARLLATLGREVGMGVTVEWWDVVERVQLRSVPLDEERVDHGSLAFDATGDRLVVGCGDLFVLSPRTGSIVARWQHHPEPEPPELANRNVTAAISSDGSILASGGREWIRLRDRVTGDELVKIRAYEYRSTTARIEALVFSADGSRIVSVGSDTEGEDPPEVRIWDVRTGALVRSIQTGPLRAVGRGAGGELVAASVRGSTIELWDLEGGERRDLGELGERFGSIGELAFDSMGSWLVAMNNESTSTAVELWELSGVEPPLRFEMPRLARHECTVAASSAGRRVAYADSGLHLLSFAGEEIASFAHTQLDLAPVMVQSPDDRWLMLGRHFLDLRAAGGPQLGRKPPVSAPIGFSRDGRWLAGMTDRGLALVDLHDRRRRMTFADSNTYLVQVVVGPGGRMVFTVDMIGQLTAWHTDTGEHTALSEGAIRPSPTLELSPNGQRVLVSVGTTMYLIDASNGTIGESFSFSAAGPHDGGAATWCGDDRIIAVHEVSARPHWTLASISLSDPDGYRELQLRRNDFVDRLYACADGRRLIIAGKYRGLLVVDHETMTVERELPGALVSIDRAGTEIFTRSIAPHGYCGDVGANQRWSVESGEELSCPADLGALIFVSGARWVLDVRGAEMRLRSATTLEVAASALLLEDHYVVTTPSGHFDGTPAGWALLLWRFSDELTDVQPVDLFFADRFTPGLFTRIWSGETVAEGRRLAQLDRRTPTIELRVNEPNEDAVDRRVEVEVHAMEGAPGSGIRDLRLFRDGVLVKAWRGDLAADRERVELRAKVDVALLGAVFSAYAFNRDDVKSRDAFAVAQPRVTESVDEVILLAIGVDRYAIPGRELCYAAADARAFTAALRRSFVIYERVTAATLVDEEATKANILAALATLAGNAPAPRADLRRADPGCIVLVFFAGHGARVGERFYLIPHDHRWSDDPECDTALSDRELAEVFEAIDARQIILIIDACYSGAALDSEEKRRGFLNVAGLAQLAFEKGMCVLSAAQSDDVAREDHRLGHGLLTHALITEGIEQGLADADPWDGVVFLTEWLEYAERRVPELYVETCTTRELEGPLRPPEPQRPRLYVPPPVRRVTILDGAIVVAMVDHADTPAAPST